MRAYREPAESAGAAVHSWTTSRGPCPSCGSPPNHSSHRVKARTDERIHVTCSAGINSEGCGAGWEAETFAAHRPSWHDTYGPPLVWAVVFVVGAAAGVAVTLAAVL